MAGRGIGKVEPVRRVWLEKKEAREYLGGCSDEWLDKLMKEEMVTVAVIGRKAFYEVASMERLMQKNVIIRQRL